MWRRRATRLVFSLAVTALLAPAAVFVAFAAVEDAAALVPGWFMVAALPPAIAAHVVVGRLRWLPEPCLPGPMR